MSSAATADHYCSDEEKKNDDSNFSAMEAAEEEEPQDCPICLDEMCPHSDLLHPLQCASSHCDFNMCATCIDSLITSSNDDYQEASDGNRHVKVFLHCPNCRSDLGPTIRETLLLRKADFLVRGGGMDLNDEALTPSQARLRGVLEEAEVVKAMHDARKREGVFFREKLEAEGGPGGGSDDDLIDDFLEGDEVVQQDGYNSDESVDEMGVEMDLTVGVHKSFRVPKHRNLADDVLASIAADEQAANGSGGGVGGIDDTLMSGFEAVLSDEHKIQVTQLLTSGDTSSLAEAAKILHRTIHKPKITKTKSFVQRRNLRSSVFVLIDEAEKARPSLEKAAANGAAAGHGTPKAAAAKKVAANTRRLANHNGANNARNIAQAQARARKRAEHLKSHPLPVRMPKYVELIVPTAGAGDPPLAFVDGVWDGSVVDAYAKITVGRAKLVGGDGKPRVTQKSIPKTNNRGVIRVLSEGLDETDISRLTDRIDVPASRVLVSAVRNEAGKRGVVKGDVVTHLNGEAFEGNAEELAREMGKLGPRVNVVLNAERSVAEALRRRACAAARGGGAKKVAAN